jgi:hypothetical protein
MEENSMSDEQQLIATPGVFGENGNFLLERELGVGGMGGVYMGRDKMLDRPVAVKVILKEYGDDQEFVEKFKKEAQAAARLIHPNIAQIYSYGICEGKPYIAMELAAGGSLFTVMNANGGKCDVARALKICQQVAQALQCASDQGCVHGDVKPENILLDASGNAKLVDFGLAAMQKDTDEIWGTPYYISPEKVRKEPIDFRADMYSLGATLYHALTGVAPFEGEDSIAVVKKRFDGAPVKPSEIRSELTPAIDELVLKMLELDRENRYPSWEAVLEAFKTVLTSGLTVKMPTANLAKPATSATGVRMATRGRRVVMRRKTTVAPVGEVTPETGASADAEAEKKSDEDEEEEGGNIALKAIGVVVGVIVVIALVIGGLVWFQIADKKARAAEERAQIVGGIEKARSAIGDTVQNAVKFADEFEEFAKRAVEECEKPTQALKRLLPPEHAAMLKPATSKELEEAIASTNEVVQAAAAPAAPAAPATNNLAKTAAATNQPAAKPVEAKDAKPAAKNVKAAEAKADKPAEPAAEAPPPVVVTMNELWERAYGCIASAVRIRHAVRQIVKKAAEAEQLAESNRANMEKLAELSRTLVDMLDQVKTSKDVENVRKGISFIKSKGESTVLSTEKRLRIEKLEAERKAKAEAAAAAEKSRKEKLEAERLAKIEAEVSQIKDKFEAIVAQGNLRQLDWKGALRQLENLKSEFKTAEGQIAADAQIRKVNNMKKVHDIFVKSMAAHVFKGKLRGAKVASVTKRK